MRYDRKTRVVVDEARRRVWELVRLLGSVLVGAALATATSCLTGGLADVPGLAALGGGRDEPQIQERPNTDLADLKVEVVRLGVLNDDLDRLTDALECPADYVARGMQIDQLAAELGSQATACDAAQAQLIGELNEALARADRAEAALHEIRAALGITEPAEDAEE